jgi:hypothetical protein
MRQRVSTKELRFARANISGQATTEFLISCLVLIPLFFGVYYTAKYADVKHSAIQASRYAAFERSWDPAGTIKSDTQLREETRARFFTSINRNQGQIRNRDTTLNINPSNEQVALWHDARHQRLIQNYSDISVNVNNNGSLNMGVVGQLTSAVARPLFRLPTSSLAIANIEVPLSNVAHFEPLSNINLRIGATTAIGSGVWNANGAKGNNNSVCARVKNAIPTTYLSGINGVIDVLVSPFERNGPDFGVVFPDYVPPGSLRNTSNQRTQLNLQNGNRC